VSFLLEAILFLRINGFSPLLVICANTYVCTSRNNTWERLQTICFALFAWFARSDLLAGIAKTETYKACSWCKHLVDWVWTVSKHWVTNLFFLTDIFLIPLVTNNKMSSSTNSKTSDCLSRVSAGNCSLNRVNLWLLFIRWFSHGNSADCKNLPD